MQKYLVRVMKNKRVNPISVQTIRTHGTERGKREGQKQEVEDGDEGAEQQIQDSVQKLRH